MRVFVFLLLTFFTLQVHPSDGSDSDEVMMISPELLSKSRLRANVMMNQLAALTADRQLSPEQKGLAYDIFGSYSLFRSFKAESIEQGPSGPFIVWVHPLPQSSASTLMDLVAKVVGVDAKRIAHIFVDNIGDRRARAATFARLGELNDVLVIDRIAALAQVHHTYVATQMIPDLLENIHGSILVLFIDEDRSFDQLADSSKQRIDVVADGRYIVQNTCEDLILQ
jgi:hypothetical protein